MIRIGACLAGALALAMATSGPGAQAAKKRSEHPDAGAAKPKSATTQTLGKSGAWAAYAANDQSGRVCYLIGQPQKSEPATAARKAPMAMVTHRPAEKIANVVSFVEGYPLKEGSAVGLDIGGNKFELFTNGDSAWASTAELDKTIVATLAKGHQAIVKGIPAKGLATTDVYVLSGFAQTLALIDKACGVERDKPRAAPARHHKTKPKAKQSH